MAPPSVYEVYTPAPQRNSNATAIITSMKVSFQLRFSASSHAFRSRPAGFSTRQCRSEFLRAGYDAARQGIDTYRRRSCKGDIPVVKGNLRTNIAKVLVNGMCRLW